MATYMFLCVGAEIPTDKREESNQDWKKYMEKMMSTQKMLDGAPFGASKVVTSPDVIRDYDWALDSDVQGYWVMDLSGFDEAKDLLKECPQFYYGGTVEVRKLIERQS